MTSRVAIYARSSPDCLLSLEDQVERLSSVACEHGWKVAGVFSDRPVSAKKCLDRRPGEMGLIEVVRSGKIDKVLVWSIDRIGRSGRSVNTASTFQPCSDAMGLSRST